MMIDNPVAGKTVIHLDDLDADILKNRKIEGGIDFVSRNRPQNHGSGERGDRGIGFGSRSYSQIDGSRENATLEEFARGYSFYE
jgi:hypothetical protein